MFFNGSYYPDLFIRCNNFNSSALSRWNSLNVCTEIERLRLLPVYPTCGQTVHVLNAYSADGIFITPVHASTLRV